MLAYRIGGQTAVQVEELFALRDEDFGWGQIMQDAGLIGRPEGVPQGPPEDAGPPEGVPPSTP